VVSNSKSKFKTKNAKYHFFTNGNFVPFYGAAAAPSRIVAEYYNGIIIQAMTRKIIKIGDSAGVTIPKSIIEKLGLRVGEEVAVDIDEKTNEVRIRADEERMSRKDKIAQRTINFIDRYRSDLEALADK